MQAERSEHPGHDTRDGMNLHALSISYRNTDVDFRGRLAFGEQVLAADLRRVREYAALRELVVLSTCNRVELYAVSEADDDVAADGLLGFLSDTRGVSRDELEPVAARMCGDDVVRHLFRVACALDSMVLGESQILGQVKAAYRSAAAAGTTGPHLNFLFQRAFALAKKVRSTSRIGFGRVSAASMAVDFAGKLFDGVGGREAMLIGTGKMSRVTLECLVSRGIGRLWVVSRTRDRAESVVASHPEIPARPLAWEELDAGLVACDMVVTSTACPEVILSAARIRSAMRRRRGRPLMIIDLAVPRDVDPEAGAIEGLYLYDLDSLREAAAENARRRRRHLERALEIVDRNVDRFAERLAIREAKRRLAGAHPSGEAGDASFDETALRAWRAASARSRAR